jgi:uncharacterized protein (DUF983 family)
MPSPAVSRALANRCPRCSQGRLFSGWLKVEPRCSACGLEFAKFNVGDGPAAFAILIVGFLLCALALWMEFKLGVPWWVHPLVLIPFALAASVGTIRMIKAWLLAAEYQHDAREGRAED